METCVEFLFLEKNAAFLPIFNTFTSHVSFDTLISHCQVERREEDGDGHTQSDRQSVCVCVCE